MERHLLLLFVGLSLAFHPASARPGGRSCHTSFLFPDLTHRNFKTFTLIRGGDGVAEDTEPMEGRFSLFKASGLVGDSELFVWTGARPAFNLVQVRLSNLHRQKLQNPSLFSPLDLSNVWREGITMDPIHERIVHTWSFSSSDPLWVARHAMWHDVSSDDDKQEIHSDRRLDDDGWSSIVKDLWRMAFGLMFGAACGMIVAVAMVIIVRLIRRACMTTPDDEDMGFLCGYQELPSPRSNEKEEAQKAFNKESAEKAENA